MTKAAEIMALAAQGLSTREIALKVYGEATEGKLAYVRVVSKQRRGSSESLHDKRWRASKHGRVVHNAKCARYYHRNKDAVLDRQRRRRDVRRALPESARVEYA